MLIQYLKGISEKEFDIETSVEGCIWTVWIETGITFSFNPLQYFIMLK